MIADYIVVIINILLIILLCGGGVVLQLFLSRAKSRWPGLILPGIGFVFSLLAILSYVVFDSADTASTIITLVLVFLLCNIPALIMLAIYAAVRGKRKKAAELERMNVQELE